MLEIKTKEKTLHLQDLSWAKVWSVYCKNNDGYYGRTTDQQIILEIDNISYVLDEIEIVLPYCHTTPINPYTDYCHWGNTSKLERLQQEVTDLESDYHSACFGKSKKYKAWQNKLEKLEEMKIESAEIDKKIKEAKDKQRKEYEEAVEKNEKKLAKFEKKVDYYTNLIKKELKV